MLRTLAGKGSSVGALCALAGAVLAVVGSLLTLREFATEAFEWPRALASAAMRRVEVEGDKTLTIAHMLSTQMAGGTSLPSPSEQTFQDLALRGLYSYDMEGHRLERRGKDWTEPRDRMPGILHLLRRGKGVWWVNLTEGEITLGAAVPIDRSPPYTRSLFVVRDLGQEWFYSVAEELDIPVVAWSFGWKERFNFYGRKEGELEDLDVYEEDQVVSLAQGAKERMEGDELMFNWEQGEQRYRVHAVLLYSPDQLNPIGIIGVAWDMSGVEEVRNQWLRFEIGAMGSAIALGILVSYLAWRGESKDLDLLAQRMKEDPLGKGLEVEDLEKRGGALRELVGACGRLVREARALLEQTSVLGDAILGSAQRQSSCAEQMSSATEELSAMVEQASRAVAHEAEMVQDLSEATAFIKNRAGQTGKGTADAVVSSQAMMDAAQRGGDQTSQTMEKMEEITSAMSDASGVVSTLRDTAQEIVGILNSMTDIAAQTRLLALNAEIEAARAGAEGREFTVVAEEVEVLADESSGAVDQINRLVQDIQSKGELAGQAMMAGMSLVEEGRSMVSATEAAIGEVIKAVQETTHLVGVMAEAARGQTKSSEEADKIVSELASVAEGNAAAMEEASASCDEQVASMEQVAESAENLLSSARAFRSMLKTYSAKEEAIAELGTYEESEEGMEEAAEEEEFFPWETEAESPGGD